MSDYILEMKHIVKDFSGVKALNDVNLKVKRGEVHALCGENGAGKSTLMNVLSGIYPFGTYTGDIVYNGEIVKNKNIKDSEKKGIVIIHQELALSPYLSIAENVFLGNEQMKVNGVIDWTQTRNKAQEMLEKVGLGHENLDAPINSLGVGKQQLIEIAKALAKKVDLLILDEPINGLDPIGIAEVRSFIRALCDERGKTILISSHILSEVALLADDIGIIDHGVLLEEESLADLEAKSDRYIRFTVSDTGRAAEVLNGLFHENQFAVQDGHHLRMDSAKVPVAKIVSAFVQQGLEVSEAATVEESLEDYFKRVTGGEGIA